MQRSSWLESSWGRPGPWAQLTDEAVPVPFLTGAGSLRSGCLELGVLWPSLGLSPQGASPGATLFWNRGRLWPPCTGATLLEADSRKQGTQQHSCPRQVAILLVTRLQPLTLTTDWPEERPWEDDLGPSVTHLLRISQGLGLGSLGLQGTGSGLEARLAGGVPTWKKRRGMAGTLALAAPLRPACLATSGCRCSSQGKGRAGSLAHLPGRRPGASAGPWQGPATLRRTGLDWGAHPVPWVLWCRRIR